MAIFLDSGARVVVQGLTGREGSFHAQRNKAYGTMVVAGVTPGKGGTEVSGIPVFDTVAQAVAATDATASVIFVPAPAAADAILEAAAAGIGLVVCITEGIPVQDAARARAQLRRRPEGTRGTRRGPEGTPGAQVRLIGPNCPGLITPGQANIGIIPGEICLPGPVGLVSRSGTLTYEIVHQLTQAGLGQSTCVGIGGDPVAGTGFVDCLAAFEADPATRAVVLIGEIGGDEEERAAAFIQDQMRTPVVAYIAGFTAPPGRRMGHAGALISGSAGTAAAKAEAFRAAGVPVASNPGEVAGLVAEALA
ncbi:MAG TPA: succinate--CoA ligase subunit alpha [Actinomycetota bacterium]|nr:succinate--CoA ligase subunit alpha [Actinomycetota bacterium]